MASLLALSVCVAILLPCSWAQEAAVATSNSSVTDTGPQVLQQPPLPPTITQPPPPAPAVNGTAPEPAPQTPANRSETAPPEVEEPKVAAKQVEGAVGLNKTLLAIEPESIKKVLGSKCSTDKDCVTINNTKCTDNMCVCLPGFVPSKHSLDKCLQVPSGIGDGCEEDSQCNVVLPDSECRDSKCECPLGYVLGDARCWVRQTLGGICNNSVQCEEVMFAKCTQGVCTCESPLIPSPVNKCLQPVENVYEAPCEEDIQCTYSYGDEARCSNGQCRCTNNFHYDGSKCVADKKLGDSCLNNEHCSVSDTEDSRMCQDNVCSCATGYSVLPGEEVCSKSSGEELAVSLTWVMCIVLAKFYLS